MPRFRDEDKERRGRGGFYKVVNKERGDEGKQGRFIIQTSSSIGSPQLEFPRLEPYFRTSERNNIG